MQAGIETISASRGIARRTFIRRTAVALAGLASTAGCVGAGPGLSRASRPPQRGERWCLSLRVLQEQAEAAQARGKRIPEQVRCLAGIGWLDGFTVDPDQNDILMLGRRTPGWPGLLLDDAVANLRNAWQDQDQPYCSLDPRPEDIRRHQAITAELPTLQEEGELRDWLARYKESVGPQMVVVGGVPRNSHHAHIMIDADYHMKKVGQGLADLPGVTSAIARSIRQAEEAIQTGQEVPPSTSSMSRYWFHLANGEPTFLVGRGGGLCLERCTVIVMTERQVLAADGQLHDAGSEDAQAKAFAAEFTANFENSTLVVPVYAALESLYRSSVLLRAARYQGAERSAGMDLSFFLERYVYGDETSMPLSLPGLANGTVWQRTVERDDIIQRYTLVPMVSGGVSMEVRLSPKQFKPEVDGAFERLQAAAVRARPKPRALAWPLLTLA